MSLWDLSVCEFVPLWFFTCVYVISRISIRPIEIRRTLNGHVFASSLHLFNLWQVRIVDMHTESIYYWIGGIIPFFFLLFIYSSPYIALWFVPLLQYMGFGLWLWFHIDVCVDATNFWQQIRLVSNVGISEEKKNRSRKCIRLKFDDIRQHVREICREWIEEYWCWCNI